MNIIYSTVNTLRDRYTPVSRSSTFRKTGQVTPDEFLTAGDYLTYRFPTWSWADADTEARRVSYLPPGKQFLVTRNVPCQRRLDDNFAGDAAREAALVHDGADFNSGSRDGGSGGASDADDDGWLRTGAAAVADNGSSSAREKKPAAGVHEVRTVDDAGNLGEREALEDDDEDIPDMEEEDDDEAIIRDAAGSRNR